MSGSLAVVTSKYRRSRSQEAGAPEPASAVDEAIGAAERFWWVSVARGSIALALGLGALLTGVAQATLVNFIAFYWLFGGLMTAKWAHGVRWRAGSRLGLAAGALAVFTSLILLARNAVADVVSVDVLIDLVAVTTVATGCLRLVGAFEIEEHTQRRWTTGGLILGSVEVCIGAVLFLSGEAATPTLRLTVGVWGVAAGSLLLIQGLRLRARRIAALSEA